jgi:ribosome-associated protein
VGRIRGLDRSSPPLGLGARAILVSIDRTHGRRGGFTVTLCGANTLLSKEGRSLDPTELAKIIAEVAADKKASDVVVLDIRELSVIADYFVICTGANARQIQAIADAVDDKLSDMKVTARPFEGSANSGWMLLDCGDVILHIFGPMEREFYRLERLWSDAPTLVYVQ